jgi:hypothetical protein
MSVPTGSKAALEHSNPNRQEDFTMRKTTGLFAIAPVLILAGAGGWASSNTQAPIATPTDVRIDLSEVAMNANQLPAQHYQDFSVIFH